MTVFSDAQTWLRGQRSAYLADTVTYARGAQSNASVKATRGESDMDADDGETIVKAKMVDWIIDKADLTLNSVEVEPEVGDKITANGSTYEVANMGQNPHYAEHGSDGLTFRIHSVQVQ